MSLRDTRTGVQEDIQSKLKAFAQGSLADNAIALLNSLGYSSEKTAPLQPNTADELLKRYGIGRSFRTEKALCSQWQSVDLLFQVTDEEISAGGQLSFSSSDQAINEQIIQSYLFFAIDLKERDKAYTRTELADITREVNKLFYMPVLILFRHGTSLTLAIIDRRLSRRDRDKDVLEKVTLIKDIRFAKPHRAHLEILFDLSLNQLHRVHGFRDFVELHAAWRKTLDLSELNKKFYQELANWYFWARRTATFPLDPQLTEEKNRDISVIRLITRLIFCWFIKEEDLIPDDLFSEKKLRTEILGSLEDEESTFYKAILQNLFFATLNTEMDNKQRPRRFMFDPFQGKNADRESKNVYRYKEMFLKPDEALDLFKNVPFLNGGLFECLDIEQDKKRERPRILIDGFSTDKKNPLFVPNKLFFAEQESVDLSDEYNDIKKKSVRVSGIIHILNHYKFTIEENTPIEEDIALDPELLGKVFENLLAAFVEETKVTARKLTGSFYTPREVVEYMVDESLIGYFEPKLVAAGMEPETARVKLRELLAYAEADSVEGPIFNEAQAALLTAAISDLQILDPACGSGAFPMGVLQKLVLALSKLDPGNIHWKEQRLERAQRDLQRAREMQIESVRDKAVDEAKERIKQIRDSFDNQNHEEDYLRKLYLIEDSIYGVDIQPIAMQIAKLRFFISLIVNQKVDDTLPNRGIRPLPNLETKFVAANTLMIMPKPKQLGLGEQEIIAKRRELELVRERHFLARGRDTKKKCREDDERLREEIAELLKQSDWPGQDQDAISQAADQLAKWNPYDQNAAAKFFDAEWMFDVRDGFDIVLANPPYVRQEQIKDIKPALKERYDCFTGVADLYVYFYESAFRSLKEGGILTFISSNKYFRAGYGAKLREMLTGQGQILQLIDFGDAPVFTAIAYPSIIVVRKTADAAVPAKLKSARNNQLNGYTFRALSWEQGPRIEEFSKIFANRSFNMKQSELADGDGWRLEQPQVLSLLKKLRERGTSLGDYVEGKFYRGILTGLNEAFVVDRETRDRLIKEHPSSAELLKPFLRGRDVKRWRVEPQDLWLIFTRRGVNIDAYPAIKKHLLQFKEQLTPGEAGGRKPGSYKWYEIQDNVAYYREFEKDKILVPAIAQTVDYAPDFSGFYSNDKTSICVTDEVHFLLGVLNSKLLWWLIRQTASTKQGGFYEFKPMYVTGLPIPDTSPTQKSEIEKFVEYILFLKKVIGESTVSNTRDPLMLAFWEQIIEGMVYELFLPEELHAAGKRFFDILKSADLPRLAEMPGDKLEVMRNHFERLFDTEHPVRKAVFFLDSIESVRIIEGKDQELANPSISSTEVSVGSAT